MLTFTFDWISTSCTVRCTSSLLYCSFNPFYLFQVLLCPLLPLQLCILSFLLRVREGWRAIQYTIWSRCRGSVVACPAQTICTENQFQFLSPQYQSRKNPPPWIMPLLMTWPSVTRGLDRSYRLKSCTHMIFMNVQYKCASVDNFSVFIYICNATKVKCTIVTICEYYLYVLSSPD